MFQFDSASLILTNGLTSLAMTAVLLVSLIGLGAEGRGIFKPASGLHHC